MSDVTDAERCALCQRPADYRCDQCGKPLCVSHRVLIEGGLGTWSRCESCNLRNKIRESPLIRFMRWRTEVKLFLMPVWFLVLAAVFLVAILYRAIVGPVHGIR
jgi:hypothetical protein